VIFQCQMREHAPIRLELKRAKYFACCEGERVAGGMYELHGFGPRRGYTVYVRMYFGARPTASMRAQVQRALDRLELPPLR
jgi:hypothetical protein